MLFLQDADIVNVTATSDKNEKKESNLYSLTGNKQEMDSLRRRLFEFLQ
jgi:hypothetical protein